MDFGDAWNTLSVGDYVSVTDGRPEPTLRGGMAWWIWRSHNFTGVLVGKSDGNARTIRFRLPRFANADVALDVIESLPHSFTAATFDDFNSVDNGL